MGDSAYKAKVLPSGVTKRIAIEAGVSALWYKYVGLDGQAIGVDTFGFSAPGNVVMDAFGINARHIVKVAESMPETSEGEAATSLGDTSSRSEEAESSLSEDDDIRN